MVVSESSPLLASYSLEASTIAINHSRKLALSPFVRSNQVWLALSAHCIMSLLWSDMPVADSQPLLLC